MLGRSHAILGIASTAVVLTAAGTNIIQHSPTFTAALSVGMVAALLPDIDSADTYLRKSFRLNRKQILRDLGQTQITRPLALISALFRWFIGIFLNFIHIALPHRGPTHYGFTAALLTLLVYWLCRYLGLPWEIWAAFGVGYFSHLLGDGVTKNGVRLYAPLYSGSVRFLPRSLCIVTGSGQEILMLFGIITLMVGGLFVFGTLG